MADIALKTMIATQGATRDLKDGAVTPPGYSFEFAEMPILQGFRRMVRGLEFDVCEMAFTTYLCAKAYGKPFTALPVFLVRAFHHGAIVRSASASAAAREPKDLEGKEVGINRGYTVTTGVWARGILQDEHGVDPGRVTWVRSGDEHVAEYRPPANVRPLEPGQDLADLVESGELAAGIGLAGPGLTPLIPDAERAGFDALRRRGLYPINHLLVVKDRLLADQPDLAARLFAAFAEAKNRYVARLRRDEAQDPADRVYRRVMEITGGDPLPYGIAPNRAMIEQLVRYAVSQRILDRPSPPEALFAESTHDLTA